MPDQERYQDHAEQKRQGRRGKKDWKHGMNIPESSLTPRVMWIPCGNYEFEVKEDFFGGYMNYTGWYREVGGRLADGRWPAWHSETGAKKYC
jgi:hypothetical protein